MGIASGRRRETHVALEDDGLRDDRLLEQDGAAREKQLISYTRKN